MEQDKLIDIFLQLRSQVDEMHGVVYRNGLVSSVTNQAKDIKELNDKMTDFLLTRDASCPYKAEVATRTKERSNKFDKRLVIYGLIIGAMSNLPELINLIIGG